MLGTDRITADEVTLQAGDEVWHRDQRAWAVGINRPDLAVRGKVTRMSRTINTIGEISIEVLWAGPNGGYDLYAEAELEAIPAGA